MAHDDLQLPIIIIGPTDVRHVLRELMKLDDYINQANLRPQAAKVDTLPKSSRSLSRFSELNKLNFLNQGDRQKAIDFLNYLINEGSQVHISFAADPSIAFLTKITEWFRNNINSLILVNVGLEPSIAAGFMLRTDNQLHDFSLRHHFDNNKQLLMNKLKQS